ncbi:MAG: SpaH/EbpB family LPXTG-anchored major pilin [Candidatus Coprovivens sp.]
MKKILSYLLVIALVLVQFLPVANAAKGTNATADGKITITNATVKETYEIYKLFDLESYSYDTNKETGAYTYTISTSSPWYNFMKTGDGSAYVTLSTYETGKEIVRFNESKKGASDVARFARLALDYAEATAKITPTNAIEATTTTVEFTGLELGYYLVDSSLGSLVSLDSTVREVDITDKNTPTTIKKEVKEGTIWGSTNTKKIGDTVEYKVEITAKKGAQNYVLKDKMSEGLTFNTDSVKVVEKASTETGVTERELTKGADYKLYTTATTEYTFKVVFTKSYLDSIESDKTLVVTYSAVVNEKAVINNTGNPNKAKLEYGDGTTTEEVFTKTYVLSFDLLKTDGTNKLDGAEFKLYDAQTGGTEILVFLKDASKNIYRVAYTDAEKNSATTIKAGNATIEGLDADVTYYLEETKAPEGYNKLTSRVPVTLVSTITGEKQTSTVSGTDSSTIKYTDGTVTVANTTGTLLPSTGGMGTVLFVTIGSIMVLGFGVLLVTKLRLSKMSI